ncbi:hypothetical protein [Nitrosomonas sp. Is79A3]|uniref:hypothetical protein n=1 Tax=Nitrosomonas sp. (strain Is79A3) TaxID=261292 RepID=UPI000301F3F7
MAIKQFLLFVLSWITANTASATRFDHTIWDDLLREHVYMLNLNRPVKSITMELRSIMVSYKNIFISALCV